MRGKALWDKIDVPICWDTPKQPVWCEDSGTCFKSSNSWSLLMKNGFYEKSILARSQNFMQIGPKMATLQEKNPKMDPKKRFFLKNPPGFSAFETSSWILTSNRPFWLAPIYWDINFVLKCLPARCVHLLKLSLPTWQPWPWHCCHIWRDVNTNIAFDVARFLCA